jgi:hypothetical protein
MAIGAASSLTAKQRRLCDEIEAIAKSVGADHWNILDYAPENRTTLLELAKNRLVRSEIIIKYALIDEYLSVIICHYYFGKPSSAPIFRSQWRTKRFRLFNHNILDELFLLPKLRLVHAIREVPNDIRNRVDRINALRNAITHSLFPENRRQYMTNKRVMYQGVDIFSAAGIEKFGEDFVAVSDCLTERAFRRA